MGDLKDALYAQLSAAQRRDLPALLDALARARGSLPPDAAEAPELYALHSELVQLVSAWRADQLHQAAIYKRTNGAPRFLSTKR